MTVIHNPLTLPSLLHSFSVQGPALCEEWKRGLLGMLVALAPEQAAQVCPPRTFYPSTRPALIPSHHDHLSDPCQLLRAGGDALLAGTKLSWNNGDYGNSTLPPPVPGPGMMGMNGAPSSSGAGAGGM
jgi:hypothetical protein